IFVVENIAGAVDAAGECAENRHGGPEGLGNLVIPVTFILEARFIDRPRAYDLGVADLENLLGIGDVIALRGERELADSVVGLIGLYEAVADREGVAGADLIVEARTDAGARPGIRDGSLAWS